MKKLKSNYVLPNCRYFSDKVPSQINSKVLSKVKMILKESASNSFTTDIWTNVSNHYFISVTAHYVNSKFERKVLVLRVAPFPGSHTSRRIADVIENILADFEIPSYMIHAFLRDNG